MSDKIINCVEEVDETVIDPVTQKYELLVREIESTDGHLGTTLKDVYEGAEPEKFLECLETRIKSHDKQIEDMCNHHYQGFIQSVHSLLQVRTDVDKLKFEIQSVNSELQASGKGLLKKCQALVLLRKQQENIDTTIDLMTACLPVLEMFDKLKKQMQNKRFYPALKTLEMLEHTYLPQVPKYTFLQDIRDSIADSRQQIKEASMNELRHFLESLRKHSGRLGEVTMKQTAKENGIDMESTKMNKEAVMKMNTLQTFNRSSKRNNMYSIMNFSDVSEEGVSAQELIDFSPVHRGLHIYSVLADKESFESYYRSQRKKQCRLVLQAPGPLNSSLEFYKSYFYEVVGFFVVEDHIMHTSSSLLPQAHMHEEWDGALAKIIAVLRSHIGKCSETEILLKVKNLLLVFCLTLRNYGFGAAPLFELLLEVRDQHSEILREQWVQVFKEIFRNDNYTPIGVTSQQQYDHITSIYPYKNANLEAEPFPKRLPFSQFVPDIYIEVKRYISACLEFSEDLQISTTEKHSRASKLLQGLLQYTLLPCVLCTIQQYKHSLVQLIQISINMEHLDHSCVFLEDFITQLSGIQQDKTKVSKLHGQSMFKSAKSEAESEIYKQIDLKIDEFFDLAAYDWNAPDLATEASSYISDIISFLNGIFQSFTNLPEKVAQTACMAACKHIAECMMKLLLSDEVKSISEAALHQMSVDLKECEEFALKVPVAGIDRATFKLAFEDLRQLLNLFLSEDWNSYFVDYWKSTHYYQRVKPATCIILVEKLKESEKSRFNLLSSFKRNEREKKKFFDSILKQLRFLTQK